MSLISRFLAIATALLIGGSLSCSVRPKHSMSVWQLPNQTPTQMMSYVIETPNGSIIVLDGGNKGDGGYLKGFLAAKGNHVHTWIITHAHDDHFGALGQMLSEPNPPAIDRLAGSMPTLEWVRKYASEKNEGDAYDEFLQVLSKSGRAIEDLPAGKEFDIDQVHFQVLAGHHPEITANPINNSSLVLRVTEGSTSILFTADLGVEGGRALLASPYARWLPANYVQMAHHGQNGADEDFYRAVKAQVCLWPTPSWLWDNNLGNKGKGSGPWKTLEVREWMDRLGIKRHIVMKDGLAQIP